MQNLKKIMNNVLVKMDTKQKEKYDLGNGKVLYWERGYEFNRRLDYPSRAIVIDGEGLPAGSEILVHHNAIEPSYQVFSEDFLTEEEKKEGYKMFSLPKDMCFCYKKDVEWLPCDEFLITLRVFKPYTGRLFGLPHEQVKNRMYCVKGEWEGQALVTLVNCDYEIVFHNTENREERLIRTRHREVLATDEGLLEKIKSGELLVGRSPKDAKKL
jgi:hypothetical protein